MTHEHHQSHRDIPPRVAKMRRPGVITDRGDSLYTDALESAMQETGRPLTAAETKMIKEQVDIFNQQALDPKE